MRTCLDIADTVMHGLLTSQLVDNTFMPVMSTALITDKGETVASSLVLLMLTPHH